jgi:hypothetical protein
MSLQVVHMRVALACGLVIAALALAGCSDHSSVQQPPSASSTTRVSGAQALAREHGFSLTAPISSSDATIPATLDGPPWVQLQPVLLAGGYDLRPYVGRPVHTTVYGIVTKTGGRAPQDMVCMESDGKVIGAYSSTLVRCPVSAVCRKPGCRRA